MFPAIDLKQPVFAELAPFVSVAVILLGWLLVRAQKRSVGKFGNLATLAHFSQLSSTSAKWRGIVCFAGVLFLAMLAASDPRFSKETSATGHTFNAILVCDGSLSMDAEDYPGRVSRHEMAKRAFQKLLDAYPDGRFGVVAFTDEAHAYEPSTDPQVPRSLVSYTCLPDVARGDGSQLIVGVDEALDLIQSLKGSVNTIVLLSDGGDPVTISELRAVTTRLEKMRVRVITGGVGGSELVNIPVYDPKTGEMLGYLAPYSVGPLTTTRLEESTLRYLSSVSGGDYRRIASGDELVEMVRAHGWDNYPVKTNEKSSAVWIPLSALLLVLFLWLLDGFFRKIMSNRHQG